jgi:hypothetical protein
MSVQRVFTVAAFDIVWALVKCVAATKSSASRAMTRAEPWMEIGRRIFGRLVACKMPENARQGLSLLYGTLRQAANGLD